LVNNTFETDKTILLHIHLDINLQAGTQQLLTQQANQWAVDNEWCFSYASQQLIPVVLEVEVLQNKEVQQEMELEADQMVHQYLLDGTEQTDIDVENLHDKQYYTVKCVLLLIISYLSLVRSSHNELYR